MGIPIEKSFVVNAPASAVWEFLTDPYRVGRCLPGAAVTDKQEDGSYAGTITVKVGPVTANYRGKMRFERLDPAAGEAEIVASGQETRGKGGADMRMKSRVTERAPAETEVTVTSDVNVVGVLAQFGRGMILDVSDQLFQRFTQAMRRELETPAAPAAAADAPAAVAPPLSPAEMAATGSPVPSTTPFVPQAPPSAPVAGEAALDLGSIGAAVAGRAAARTLRRTGFWIGILFFAALIYWLVRSHS
jgi:uncharacterized protein